MANKKNQLVKLAPDAVIFDLDGTLIDSGEVYFQVLAEACQRLELPIPEKKTVLEAIGEYNGNLRILRILPAEIGIYGENVIKKLMQTIGELFPEMFRKNVRLISKADSLITKIHRAGIKLGIVTTTHLKNLKLKMTPLEKAGIANLFQSVLCIEDVGKCKPDPSPLIKCAEKIGAVKTRCIYVGDSWVDIRAGNRAGMMTVGVLTGMDNQDRLLKEAPDLIIPSVADLLDIIDFKEGELPNKAH